MHKIDHPTATPGGLFTIGDPVGAVPATVVTDDWLNAVQTEVVNVIEGAGLALDKGNNAQLLAALQALIPPAETAWKTGDVKLSMQPTPDGGWILCNDGTIGNAVSGASTRANDDCEALFMLLWANVSNSYAPVSGGRGASAAADWAAGKTIGLTKMMGRALAVAGAGAGLTARSLGQTVGAETHTLTEAQMPKHGHPTRVSRADAGGSVTGGGLIDGVLNTLVNLPAWNGAPADTEGRQIGGAGGDQAHPIMQPTVFLHAHIKL